MGLQMPYVISRSLTTGVLHGLAAVLPFLASSFIVASSLVPSCLDFLSFFSISLAPFFTSTSSSSQRLRLVLARSPHGTLTLSLQLPSANPPLALFSAPLFTPSISRYIGSLAPMRHGSHPPCHF